ncbi:hypothetical protein ACLMJK_001699 [Lecanora helva]
MDVTASTITVISSVWTLTWQCKKLVESIKNSDRRIDELVRKVESFTTVVTQIEYAYKSESAAIHDLAIGPDEDRVRTDIQKELSRCARGLQAYKAQVSDLLKQRKPGKLGVPLNTWREKVASFPLETLEKTIADHQYNLQSLMNIHHGHELQEIRKDLKQVLTVMYQTFEKVGEATRTQGTNEQDESSINGLNILRRQDSNITLVNPAGALDGDAMTNIEGEDSNASYAFAQKLFNEVINQMVSSKGSISSLGQFQGVSGPATSTRNTVSEPRGALNLKFSTPQYMPSEYVDTQVKKPSFERRRRSDTSSPLSQTFTRRSDASSDNTSFNGSPQTSIKRSISELPGLSNSAERRSSECVVSDDEESLLPCLDEELLSRTDKVKGKELLEAIKINSKEIPALLDSNASLEEKDDRGRTPLLLAASLGQDEIMKRLITHGANVHAVDNDQATALHIAAKKLGTRESYRSVMSLLLKSRTASHVKTVNSGTAININSFDKSGRTPLHYCTISRCAEDDMEEVAKDFITQKADINAKDKNKRPPIYYAVDSRRYSVVKLLLERGAVLDFERPGTSPEIGRLLDTHRTEKIQSQSSGSPKARNGSVKGQKERRGSKFSLWS